jgi:ABC-type branched-subunit amino acid transport system substrate-binding protein
MDVRKNLPAYWEEIEEARPAYTDESLATVLWTGVDPTGRKLNPIMPLYHLEDSDMAIMVHYLKNLSVDLPPGVDDTTIRFATVVSEDIPAEAREAMLAILQAHVDVRNSQSRHQERRAESGPFYKTEMHQAYRRWELDIWKLQGPANTWSRQLREYYQKQPVFALLGGLAEGSWQPIHEFCEEHKIPAIFPLTDFPVISESDWYTLYFSKGFYQEGEAAARYLHAQENIVSGTKIVMVSRQGMAGSYLNRGFSESWQVFGMPGPEHIKLAPDKKLSEQFWSDIMQAKQPDVLILWLEPVDLADISTLVEETKLPGKIILSAEMLNYSFTAIPDNLRDNVYLTYSYSLPDSQKRSKQAVKQWLRARKIPVTDLKMQSKMYFLGWMLAGAVKSMRSEFFRDYFLEGFDMMIDQDYAIAVYPRLTFGSGQRYASKGCYIVQLTKGPDPKLVEKSNWIIH